jgi:hypothetical protein
MENQMCRNIKTLFNFEPPATDDEIHASALQFVRKLSGFNRPSQANEAAFNRAVEEVSAAAHRLLTSLHTHAPATGPLRPRRRRNELVVDSNIRIPSQGALLRMLESMDHEKM